MLQQKIRRQTKKISSLKDIIENLKRNQLLKEAPAELLKDQFSGLTLEMLKNEMQNAKRKCRGHCNTEEVKKCALTFISTRQKHTLTCAKDFHFLINHQ